MRWFISYVVGFIVGWIIRGQDEEQPRWIPCSERMPKPNEFEGNVLKYYLIQNEFGDMMVCSWDGKHWTQIYQYKHIQDKVVAWRERPTQYRKGGENEYDTTESQ